MIEIAGTQIALDDPRLWVGVALAVLVVLFAVLIASARASRRQMRVLGRHVKAMAEGQEGLRTSLQMVSDTATQGQVQVVQVVEQRLADVQQQMQDRLADNALRAQRSLSEMQERMHNSLHGSAKQTTGQLSQLQERLRAIDKAQDNITRLSGDVLSLQDILSNKQTRGAFGEIQLRDILSKALPPDAYSWQHTLSNGMRADCLVHLPQPPGPIVIDSKFPLEPYEALRSAETEYALKQAVAAMKAAVTGHIRAISEKYILEGETADGALMFLPSEAVYAELHANFPDLIRRGFEARVWIVSPTTCMATLNTMRAVLKDARMREQAGAIRRELALLVADVDRLGIRVGNLDRHFGQAAKDIEEIRISADKAGRRANRLDSFDFEDIAPGADVVPLERGT